MSLKPPAGSVRSRSIVGRGQGSGKGCTSGRGNKGQKARAGYSRRVGFEGGQMPLARRLPKRGFNNSNYEKGFQIVKVGDLNKFDAESVVDYQALLDRGLVSRKCRFVKLLAGGELDRKLTVKVDKVSAQALKQVEKSGGSVEILKVREK